MKLSKLEDIKISNLAIPQPRIVRNITDIINQSAGKMKGSKFINNLSQLSRNPKLFKLEDNIGERMFQIQKKMKVKPLNLLKSRIWDLAHKCKHYYKTITIDKKDEEKGTLPLYL